MNKDLKIYLILVVIILFIIGGIYAIKYFNKETPEEKTMKCIASGAVLYSSKTCGHCKTQKEILGDYLSLFKQIDCFYETDQCREANIEAYPTWLINEKYYEGVRTINELAELTGCECSDNLKDTTDEATCNISNTCINSLDNQCTQ